MNTRAGMPSWLVLLLAVLALPAAADSLVTSSAVGGSSASSAGSASSASLGTSSDSSSPDKKVAEGPYRIVEVARLPERPGEVRLTLRAEADPGSEVVLHVPQATFDQSGLGAGATINARHRPYGLEFASADTRQPFFLVLDDDWYRELPSRPVVL